MRMSFREVFERHERITIPLLQRDYAHGRTTTSVTEVRKNFLTVLRETLEKIPDDPRLPLDLDFVYGVPEGSTFLPLDGQQRLTTLFLLHAYLAVRDECFATFQEWMRTEGNDRSRFSYEVRPSSRDFFDALVTHFGAISLDQGLLPGDELTALGRTLEDQAWFFQSWRQDPTVRACLVVLDAIHGHFQTTRGLFARLVSGDAPAITFQFLDLKHFGLTDDLYIKMNARGKLLTEWESFKATLEGRIERTCPGNVVSLDGTEISLRHYVAQRFDTVWCNFFWRFRTPDRSYDVVMMNAIRAVAMVAWIDRPEPHPEEKVNEVLGLLRIGNLRTYYDYESAGCLDDGFVDTLVKLFDAWAEGGHELRTRLSNTNYFDEITIVRRVLHAVPDRKGREGVPYGMWVAFVGWCLHLVADRPDEFADTWMRVVVNLADNTIFNRVDEFRQALAGLRRLLVDTEATPLLEHLTADGAVEGFFRAQQVREERLKAHLMLRTGSGEDWRGLIVRAETHPYFRGQIEFLLAFSGVLERWVHDGQAVQWSDEDDGEFRTAFLRYLERAEAVFSGGQEPGLGVFSDFVWERALLCEGDYLLSKGSNHSFLDNTDREASWKRLLRGDLEHGEANARRDIVRRVLDVIDPADAQGSLEARIAVALGGDDAPRIDDWRRRLVEDPGLISLCGRRQVRRVPGGSVFLLSKVRRSGRHWDLFVAHLARELQSAVEAGEYAPFDALSWEPVMTDSENPSLWLMVGEGQKLWVQVTYHEGKFWLQISEELEIEDEGDEDEGKNHEDEEELRYRVSTSRILDVLKSLAQQAAKLVE